MIFWDSYVFLVAKTIAIDFKPPTATFPFAD